MDGDGTDAGSAGRVDVVNAADCGDDPFDRRTQKAAIGFGAGAVVNRRDDHRRTLDLRILLHRQGCQGSRARKYDHQVDDHSQYWVFNENVGERTHVNAPRFVAQCLLSRWSCCRGPFSSSLVETTSTPSRNLKDPEAATRSPAESPARITT